MSFFNSLENIDHLHNIMPLTKLAHISNCNTWKFTQIYAQKIENSSRVSIFQNLPQATLHDREHGLRSFLKGFTGYRVKGEACWVVTYETSFGCLVSGNEQSGGCKVSKVHINLLWKVFAIGNKPYVSLKKSNTLKVRSYELCEQHSND